ncbi:3-phosphoshikimate 1-carboxyvinyltransferase [Roseovarius sp. SCSIO 43702]|uniref:3-phosphoshikimate 1-carboxyvinyltransferase n=1 Tax=Roseovarius sp. SCSIO 43702 TaxID=2823043 RepID=UPI001C737276|nr:3-phosphoshikimate 1-carboxyvinyltransferase [Roseovarius sp. SCSIO 43702]QYX57359.1 3-phosphoshikimate 1-carboxyvinyltransferase [Roseovarius sp. SCSIO 43702]
MSSTSAIARITPAAGPLSGRVTLPGSKSVTNRALLVAALARGKSRLSGILRSDDTHHMMVALRAMGVEIEEIDATTLIVTGTGSLLAPDGPLFLGNAGTAVRFLTAAAALVDGQVTVTGDEHMQKRPIAPLVDTLRRLGVAASSATGCPPVVIDGTGTFETGDIAVSGQLSSQYISAIMMLAAMGEDESRIRIEGGAIGAVGYLHITAAVMRAFGATVTFPRTDLIVIEPGGYVATDYHVEPDASAATYLWAAEALTGGRIDIGTSARDFNQPDAAAYVPIVAFPRMPDVIEGSQMQDAIPTLAVLAAFSETPVRFTGIGNLRVKECDRIEALRDGLTRIRSDLATVEGDDLIVHGDPKLRGAHRPARIDSYADHRIAMCFALAGLLVDGIEIEDPMCVSKTFPDYWDVLRELGVRIKIEGL